MTKPEDEDAASGKSAPGTPPTGSLPEATADETEVAPPKVQAPPLSPAIEPICAPAASDTAATDAAIAPAKQPGRGGDSLSSRAALRRRLKLHRRLLHAASLLVAAGLGGLIGAFAADRWAGPRSDIPAIEESRKLQRSVAQLGKEMAALKADLERATRRVPDQAAKPQTSDHAARLDRTEQDVTGTTPPKQATVEPLPQTAPLPPPRPRHRRLFRQAAGTPRLVDPRCPRRLCLRRGTRRRLPGGARRALARSRSGRGDQARERRLGRGDARRPHRRRPRSQPLRIGRAPASSAASLCIPLTVISP